MKVQAILFSVAGVSHCFVDTRESADDMAMRLAFMRRYFPQNNARLVNVEVLTEDVDTLIPAADPLAPESFRATMETLTEEKK